MPKNIAQWTGFAVTVIIVLGRDADVLTAVPLGIAAGMLASLFQAAMRMQLRPIRLAVPAINLRHPVAVVVRASSFAASQLRGTVALARHRPKRRHAQFRE
jgi:hypothetical protein